MRTGEPAARGSANRQNEGDRRRARRWARCARADNAPGSTSGRALSAQQPVGRKHGTFRQRRAFSFRSGADTDAGTGRGDSRCHFAIGETRAGNAVRLIQGFLAGRRSQPPCRSAATSAGRCSGAQGSPVSASRSRPSASSEFAGPRRCAARHICVRATNQSNRAAPAPGRAALDGRFARCAAGNTVRINLPRSSHSPCDGRTRTCATL